MRARIMVIWIGCVKENKENRSDFKYSYFRRGGGVQLTDTLVANMKERKEPRMTS